MKLSQNHSENICETYRQSIKSGNYRKQPYWALHTYFRKYRHKNTNQSTWDITSHVPLTTAGELKHYICPGDMFVSGS